MHKARKIAASKKRETDHAQKKVEDKDVAREAEQRAARSLEMGLDNFDGGGHGRRGSLLLWSTRLLTKSMQRSQNLCRKH